MNRVSKGIIGACVLGCVLALLFALVCSSFDSPVHVGCVLAVVLAGVALLTPLAHFNELSDKRFMVALFIIIVVFYSLFVLLINSPQISDFKLQIDAARKFNDGDYEVFFQGMFVDWPDLLGFTLLECLLLQICDKVMFIKGFEILCAAGSVVVAYSCMRLFASKKVSRTLVCLLATFPTFFLMVETANNQVLSAFLALLGMRFFLGVFKAPLERKRRLLLYAACGVVIALARFIRPDAVLVEVALMLVVLMVGSSRLEEGKASSRWLNRFLAFGALLIPFILIGALASSLLIIGGIKSPEATGEHVTVNKLMIGTDLSTGGVVGGNYPDLIKEEMEKSGKDYNKAAIKIIRDRLTSADYVKELLIAKSQKLWWRSWFHFCLPDTTGTFRSFLFGIDKAFVALLCCGTIVSCLALWRDRRRSQTISLVIPFFMTIVLTICAYALIEVQPRYLYFAYIIMFIFIAYGLERASSALKTRLGTEAIIQQSKKAPSDSVHQ